MVIVQSTSKPVNDNLMELIFMVSACKRAGAAHITVVMPFYGYARQERKKAGSVVPISAADVSQILESMGVDKIATIDLHAPAVMAVTTAKVNFEDYEAGLVGIDWFNKNI